MELAGRYLDRLKAVQLDSLSDTDRTALIDFCTATLTHFEEGESKSKEKESQSQESGQQDKEATPDWSPAGDTTYVFNIGATVPWPASKGASNREREIARRKEQ